MKETSEGSIALSLRLIKAAELARQSRFKEAQSLLSPGNTPPEDPTTLHALAAIVTQAGDYPRALGLWQQLLQRDPKHREASEMIVAIETWTSRPAWFRFLPVGAGVAALLIAGIAWWAFSRPSSPPSAGSPTSASTLLIQPAPAPVKPSPPASVRATPTPPSTAATGTTQSDPPLVKIQVLPPPKAKKN